MKQSFKIIAIDGGAGSENLPLHPYYPNDLIYSMLILVYTIVRLRKVC